MLPLLLLALIHSPAFTKNLTDEYRFSYNQNRGLSVAEVSSLKRTQIVLIPGILAESFIEEDRSAAIDFSKWTKDYFSSQESHLRNKYQLDVKRLATSSFYVEVTKNNIKKAFVTNYLQNKKTFFITHSLGGLVLLDTLIEFDERFRKYVQGIIFLQSPFYGSPVASVYLEYPFATSILPFLNASEETIQYLSPAAREVVMQTNHETINGLRKSIPMLTVSGIANNYKSLLKPSMDLIKYGCLHHALKRCLTPILYQGPYEDSDGMVPLKSSRIENVDFVELSGVDHAETVLDFPFSNVKKKEMTEVLMQLILKEGRVILD